MTRSLFYLPRIPDYELGVLGAQIRECKTPLFRVWLSKTLDREQERRACPGREDSLPMLDCSTWGPASICDAIEDAMNRTPLDDDACPLIADFWRAVEDALNMEAMREEKKTGKSVFHE